MIPRFELSCQFTTGAAGISYLIQDNMAAFTDVTAAHEQDGNKEGSCYRVNVLGTKNIVRACQELDKHLIHISTDFVFDGKNPPAGGYTEKDRPNPIEWYGKTKLLAEEAVQENLENWTILRLAFPYKAKRSRPELEPKVKPDLVRKIKGRLEEREELRMFSDQVITPTFIDDVAVVMDYVFCNRPRGIYHMVGSTPISPFDLARKVAETFDLDKGLVKQTSLVEFMKTNSRPRQQKMALSNRKLSQEFGIKMKTVDEGLSEIKKQLT